MPPKPTCAGSMCCPFAAHDLSEPALVLSASDHATAAQRRGEYRLVEPAERCGGDTFDGGNAVGDKVMVHRAQTSPAQQSRVLIFRNAPRKTAK